MTSKAKRRGPTPRSNVRLERERARRRTRRHLAQLAVLITALTVALWFQWPVIGQPDVRASVVAVTATGHDTSCGKNCSCKEGRIDFELSDGRPGRVYDCKRDYQVGDATNVRRERGRLLSVQVEPLSDPLFFTITGAVSIGLALWAGHGARKTEWGGP